MTYLQCRKCGEEKHINFFPIHPDCKLGVDQSRCKVCKNKESRASYHNSSRERKILNRARSRATSRNIEFNLSIVDIEVPEICPVLGTLLNDDFSIDRLNPDKGYVKENINIISLRANIVKGDATLEELESVVRWMKEKM